MMDVNTVIDNICTKIGTTTDILVPELARYMEFSSLSGIIICSICIIICAILIRVGYKLEGYNENKLPLYIFGGLGLFFATVIFMCNLHDYIMWHNVPMGAVVNYIIHSLGK